MSKFSAEIKSMMRVGDLTNAVIGCVELVEEIARQGWHSGKMKPESYTMILDEHKEEADKLMAGLRKVMNPRVQKENDGRSYCNVCRCFVNLDEANKCTLQNKECPN